MRRVFSFVLLAAALLGQMPVACLALGHGTAVAGKSAMHAGAHAHHGHGVQASTTVAQSPEDDSTRGDSSPQPCAAIARCHWSALPQDALPALEVDGRIIVAGERAALRPAEAVYHLPTPPPRHIS